MFTGVIEQIGTVLRFEEYRGKRKLYIQNKWNDLQAGESIAVNGIALTLLENSSKGEASFFVPQSAMERSNFNLLEPGVKVNLERSLTLTSRLNGHWVQGQSDARAMVLNCLESPDGHRLTIALDPIYGRYCIERGALTVNGVSLRIQSLTQTKLHEFMITLLLSAHVWKTTNLSELKIGDFVHVEVDVLTKYVEKLCPQGTAQPAIVNIVPLANEPDPTELQANPPSEQATPTQMMDTSSSELELTPPQQMQNVEETLIEPVTPGFEEMKAPINH